MMDAMRRQDIVAFATRDWAAAADAKSRYWAERKRSMAADQALAGVLLKLRVPWYLFGAQSAIVWGRPRLTADVDVTVRLGTEQPGG